MIGKLQKKYFKYFCEAEGGAYAQQNIEDLHPLLVLRSPAFRLRASRQPLTRRNERPAAVSEAESK
jgi:hypothetical protein